MDKKNNIYKGILLPDTLCDKAERYIKKVIDFLKKSDKLNVIDEGSLYILADSYNQYIKATERVDEEGLTVSGSRNMIVAHPCVRIAKDAKSTCINIMTEMGLTIKSRSKMNVLDSEVEKSPLESFLLND